MLFLSGTHALFLLALFVVRVRGVLQYIDDQDGDSVTGVVPVYFPLSRDLDNAITWASSSSFCASCTDSQQPFDNTYSTSSSKDPNSAPRTITFSFTGALALVYPLHGGGY
jgi:hypothetical protein